MKTIVFFLEEPSAREMLNGLLPRMLPSDIHVRYLIFQGKQDLEKNLARRLRGWLNPDSKFVVMRDQDAGDCRQVKRKLATLCNDAGKESVLIRIACHELESFYLGDLAAVERGLGPRRLSSKQNNAKYRNPDRLANPSEELKKLTVGGYQKISGSRAIGKHLSVERNFSTSFNMLVSGIQKLVNAF